MSSCNTCNATTVRAPHPASADFSLFQNAVAANIATGSAISSSTYKPTAPLLPLRRVPDIRTHCHDPSLHGIVLGREDAVEETGSPGHPAVLGIASLPDGRMRCILKWHLSRPNFVYASIVYAGFLCALPWLMCLTLLRLDQRNEEDGQTEGFAVACWVSTISRRATNPILP